MKMQGLTRKTIPALLLAVLCLCSLILGAAEQAEAAESWPSGTQTGSESVVVMEVNTGAVLYEKNSHEKLYPASITKILTTLLALENCSLDETVVFSKDAVYKNEGDTSHIARDVGEEMTVEQTLYGVMLESANECAWAIAEHTAEKVNGGGEPEFIDMMNARAAELGCTDTHFNNPNGLPDEEHYTSAYDMALISCEAYKNEDFRTITGTKSYTIPPTNKHSDQTFLNNHHKILHYYKTGSYVNQYCTGGKTGYTSVARHTLVTYAEKDGMTLCIVVMKAEDPEQLNDTNRLIDYCFSNFYMAEISEEDLARLNLEEKSLGLLNANERFVSLDAASSILLPVGAEVSDAQCTMTTDEDSTGGSLATLEYTYAGHTVGTAHIVTSPTTAPVSIFEQVSGRQDKNEIRISPLWLMVAVIVLILAALALILLVRLVRFLNAERAKRYEKWKQERESEAAKLDRGKSTLRRNERRRQSEQRRLEREKRAQARAARRLAREEARQKPDEAEELEILGAAEGISRPVPTRPDSLEAHARREAAEPAAIEVEDLAEAEDLSEAEGLAKAEDLAEVDVLTAAMETRDSRPEKPRTRQARKEARAAEAAARRAAREARHAAAESKAAITKKTKGSDR